jgi:plastocyanin
MRIPIPGRGPAALAATLVLAAALAACSSGPAATSAAAPTAATPSAAASAAAPPSAGGAANAVTIKDFAFGPGTITVSAGSTVTWTNQDTAGHTVTADDGSFDSKTLAGGASFSQAFAKAGTYAYHCNIHSSMTATVVVK